jgi:rRNA maturation endonuclease Nob1
MAIDRSRSNSYYPGTDTKVTDSIYIYKCNHCGHSAWALIRKDECSICGSNDIDIKSNNEKSE